MGEWELRLWVRLLLVFGLSPLALTGLIGAPVLAVLALIAGNLLLVVVCVLWFAGGWVWLRALRTSVRVLQQLQ